MSFVGRRAAWLALVVAIAVVVASAGAAESPEESSTAVALQQSSSSSRGPDEDRQEQPQLADPEDATPAAGQQVAAKDTSLAEAADDKGHSGHSGHAKPMKTKKKKPMGKHKKKKQSFKDKLLPLLLIPFVIQTMLIPMFVMNLKLLAMKAMAVGKFAILLIAFNMFRSWSQNAHSTSVRGTMDSLMAQNYGFNGGPEFGAFFNGR